MANFTNNALLLKGNLTVNGIDVSDQITSFTFQGVRDTVELPATFGAPKSNRAGSDSYEVNMEFLQSATPSNQLTEIIWTALDSANSNGEIVVAGTFAAGAVSASNPRWTATAYVVAGSKGGAVDSWATDSVTYPLKARPVKSIS